MAKKPVRFVKLGQKFIERLATQKRKEGIKKWRKKWFQFLSDLNRIENIKNGVKIGFIFRYIINCVEKEKKYVYKRRKFR